jgi:enoyl-[acyl-carrier protein] reductase I
MGVANDSSIAWGVAQSLAEAGAQLALSFLPDSRGRSEGRVRRLAEPLGCELYLPCDVLQDGDVDRLFEALREQWGALDILVHAIAAARSADLAGEFTALSREGFALAQEVSCYSLIAAARGARSLMAGRQGSIVTVSYLGSQRTIPNYNVMGVAKAALESAVRYLALELGAAGMRVNAVSPGPIETLSSSVIAGFPEMLKQAAERAPLRRNVTAREVGDVVAFLCSDLARGITGQLLYVDAGFSSTAGI